MTTPEPSPATSARPAASRLPAYERRILGGSALIAAPGLLAAAFMAWSGSGWREADGWVLAAAVIVTALLVRWQRRRLVYPLQSFASLLDALRLGDYSLRGRVGGALDDLVYDINALAERLQQERLQFEESSYLLGKTLAALDNAVLVFDQDTRLRLLNPAAQQLLQADRHQLFGRRAEELGLQPLLDQPSGQLLNHRFAGRSGRFEIRHAPLRTEGRGGRLLVINDVGRVLREEERQAWQRLLRVLGHEVNNSLAPIQSMAGTLATLALRDPLPEDWREDFRNGLELIGHRSGALSRFLASYSRLTRLPPPQRREVALGPLLEKVVRLESRLPVTLDAGPALHLMADPDQLEQALINLVRNAAEASLPTRGGVVLRWQAKAERVSIEILDEGEGPPASDNLFVPFFTTKPGGSGIGLALVRQIAEAHDGGVSLLARTDARGAVATLWLPQPADHPQPP
ncbi:sensor histidine kinase [Dyella ginsengisoli]|uniref:sensor histidine kinase n=1 Tax=Dyella ginsengisoli TaxID=363848 RepID=UPI00034989D3|nr:ATP-binding protein [Dyella ginsengisoli]